MAPRDAALSLLIVEDNPADADLVRDLLDDTGHREWSVTHVQRLGEALEHLMRDSIDCILLDLGLPDAHGLDGLGKLMASFPGTPVVVLTGRDDEALALEALRHGAQDYLLKGHVGGDLIARSVRYAVERKKMDTAKSEFIARAAHELRTPLAVVAGMSETLGERYDEMDREQLQEVFEALRRQGRRAGELITKLLDLSQVEMGRITFTQETFPLSDAARTAIGALPVPPNVNVSMHLADAVWVEADQLRVEQIIANLLTNAYKYGGEEIVVEVTEDDGYAVVVVQDNGPGIPREFEQRLFEPFARGDDTANLEGSGLGLAICKRLAEGCGGQISYRHDGGARFELRLPLHRGS